MPFPAKNQTSKTRESALGVVGADPSAGALPTQSGSCAAPGTRQSCSGRCNFSHILQKENVRKYLHLWAGLVPSTFILQTISQANQNKVSGGLLVRFTPALTCYLKHCLLKLVFCLAQGSIQHLTIKSDPKVTEEHCEDDDPSVSILINTSFLIPSAPASPKPSALCRSPQASGGICCREHRAQAVLPRAVPERGLPHSLLTLPFPSVRGALSV